VHCGYQLRGEHMKRTFLGLSVIVTSVFLSAIASAKDFAPDQYSDDPSACDMVAGNLVMNCGFETGDFAGWTRSGDPTFTMIDSGSAHSGMFGLDTGPTSDLSNLPQFDYMRFDFDVFACGTGSELKFGFLQFPSFFHFDDVVVVRTVDDQ